MTETNTFTTRPSYEISSNKPETVQLGIKKDGSWCLVGGFRFEKHNSGTDLDVTCGIRYKEIPFMPAGSFEEIEPTLTGVSKGKDEGSITYGHR